MTSKASDETKSQQREALLVQATEEFDSSPEEELKRNKVKPEDCQLRLVKIGTILKEAATRHFKDGRFEQAFDTYEKALRYANFDPASEHSDEPAERALAPANLALRVSLWLNIALVAGKTSPPNWRRAKEVASRVIDMEKGEAKDKAKALYRRAYALRALNADIEAEKDLVLAQDLAPDDAAIKAELNRVREALEVQRKRQKQKFSKLFA